MAGDRVNSRISQSSLNRTIRVWWFRLLLLIALIFVVVLGWFGFRSRNGNDSSQINPTVIALATSLEYTATPSITTTQPPPSATFTLAPTRSVVHGTLFYSARVDGRTHCWAYVPGDPAPVQLTDGEWDDRFPAVSPDGLQIAFSSNRDGFWNLYLQDIRTGDARSLTDTSGYEGHPTWSPDGHWLAFEAYYDGDYDIWIIPINGEQGPIQLTDHHSMDISPAWDPQGRRITFVSDRDGSADIFIADLDRPDERFFNLTNTPLITEYDPAFSPDGTRLIYTASSNGVDLLKVQDLENLDQPPLVIGQGRAASWSPDGYRVTSILYTPQTTHLQIFSLVEGGLPQNGLLPISGASSLDWSASGLPGEAYTAANTRPTSMPLYERSINQGGSAIERYTLIDLPGVSAPNASLADTVDEAFNALRTRTADVVGWDFLGSLENAFVGLNDALPPGSAYNDWLFTGRAFAFNKAAVQAGWVEVVREDFGGQTYWRVFVRAGVQDGSLGEPMRFLPWDFGTRNSGDPSSYDHGGSLRSTIPEGYYVDFTQLAADFAFERVPALTNWHTFYPSARFNEFALTDGLDWMTAMLEIYPASAIVTPTIFRTPTSTPTRTPRPTATPWWWRWRTPTPIPTYTPYLTPTSSP